MRHDMKWVSSFPNSWRMVQKDLSICFLVTSPCQKEVLSPGQRRACNSVRSEAFPPVLGRTSFHHPFRPQAPATFVSRIKGCSHPCLNSDSWWEWPERPWSHLHVDYAGPLRGHVLGGCWCLFEMDGGTSSEVCNLPSHHLTTTSHLCNYTGIVGVQQWIGLHKLRVWVIHAPQRNSAHHLCTLSQSNQWSCRESCSDLQDLPQEGAIHVTGGPYLLVSPYTSDYCILHHRDISSWTPLQLQIRSRLDLVLLNLSGCVHTNQHQQK